MAAANPTYFAPQAPTLTARRNWRPIAGAIKMTALLLEGIGIIVSAVSIGFLVSEFNNPFGTPTGFISFLNTLEGGLIIAGVGAMVLGVALFLESL
jgi:hypothetical protein